ncbi:MAG: hypothetical protein QXQ29_02040 [Candidatus Bathyarchaeia archaeon]
MGVRVRLKVTSRSGRSIETSALVNTGFETLEPQLLLPVKAAEELGLWPNPPREASIEIYDTAGGPTKVYRIPGIAEVKVLAMDRESLSVVSDIVVSNVEFEVLISDKLAEELMISIEKPSRGIWRFRDEVKERGSEKPTYWL